MPDFNLLPFQFNAKHVDVRIDAQGAPWWELQAICDVLGLTDTSKVASRLRPHETTTTTFILDKIPHQLLLVNESGLYRVIMRSNKPAAEKFQDWVCQEVIPSIRRTGSYGTPQVDIDLRKEVAALQKQVKALAARPPRKLDGRRCEECGERITKKEFLLQTVKSSMRCPPCFHALIIEHGSWAAVLRAIGRSNSQVALVKKG